MTPTDYRNALAALNLSQVSAASLFGVNDRTSRRWAIGEQDVPQAVALCLRLMLAHSITPELARKMMEEG